MTAHRFDRFGGIYPRLPDSLLPKNAASIALNCDFAYGELRNVKDGYKLNVTSMANVPLAIYTDDGASFYTWATDVDAVRSPLVSDTRLYYTDGSTTMKVASRMSTSATGGTPPSPYDVGVPKPTTAPTLAVSLPNLSDATKYTLAFTFHYELAGVKYQETTLTLGSGVAGVGILSVGDGKYRFTPPTASRQISYSTLSSFPSPGASGVVYKATDTGLLYTWNGSAYVTTTNDATPTTAVPVIRITATAVANSSSVFDIYTSNSGIAGTGGIWTATILNDTGADTYTVTLGGAITEADKDTRAYVYTIVNISNEEGPPSPPTIVDTAPLVDVVVTCTLPSMGTYTPVKEIRIYRTPTGSAIADYFYVGAIPLTGQGPGTYAFTDNVKAELLNEPLSSLYYYPPPTGLAGLMVLPNGILCAWKGNELWFSEAYKPWAWPPSYVKPLPHTIVGGIPHGSGAIITTRAQPYGVSGASPDSMTLSRINVDQAGVSKWSLAVVDGAAMYASNDGLVVMNGGSASLEQGQRFFTREVWRARYGAYLSGMRFSVWDGRLIVFHGSGLFTPFMIRFDEADGAMTDLPNFTAACAFVSVLSDQCYFAKNADLYQFNGGSDLDATWQSAELLLPKPQSLGIIQAVSTGTWALTISAALTPLPATEGYAVPDPSKYKNSVMVGPWSVTINATGISATTTLAAGTNLLRLPPGFVSDRWRIKLVGNGRFRELRIAESGRALTTV